MKLLEELFLKILNMGIAAGWLVLAVLVLRLILKRAPRWANVVLWGLVALRLLCPVSPESALSLIPSAETVSPDIMMEPLPGIQTGIPVVNRIVNPAIRQSLAPVPGASVNPLQIWIPALALFWIIGVAALLIYTAISYWRLRRSVDTAVLLRDNLFQSERVGTPFVLGICKPRIYLPFQMESQSLEHVIAHEQAHIRRRDHWWKPLGFFLLAVYWFHPLLWMAYVLLCRDIELACDEKVIRVLDSRQRADYTQALLACRVRNKRTAPCPLAFGEVGVKTRVRSVMNYKKPALQIVAVSILACALMAVCFLTNPREADFDIRIVVPAHSQAPVVYSEEEISPTKDYIRITSGENLGDTEVSLKPVEVRQENAYDKPAYLTPGMPVRMEAEKGGWFRIGIQMQNPTDEDIIVYVNVQNIEVRIPSGSQRAVQWFDYSRDPSGMDWDQELTASLPEFPGVIFQCTPEQIVAVNSSGGEDTGEGITLIEGMPIWNVYFYDLTGDGRPELCASLSFGSGMIDNRVVIYDYGKGASYTLEDRGEYDYYLRMDERDGCLYVDKKEYDTERRAATGRLVFQEECIAIGGW